MLRVGNLSLKFALLADYAAVMNHGKFLIAGDFDQVIAPKLPTSVAAMYFAARVYQHGNRTLRRRTMHLSFLNPAGGLYPNDQPDVPVLFQEGPNQEMLRADIVVGIEGLLLSSYGEHRVGIKIDQHDLGHVSLWVREHE